MNAPASFRFAELLDQFAKTRLPRDKASQLPGEVYTSPAIAALEKERIFLDTWLCIGRVEEIAKPGDYMTHQIAGEPFIVARDVDGTVSAFMNMCLHRGVPVAAGRGNAKDFSCPYHAWLYDLTGKLIATPHMGKCQVDMQGWRMRPLQCTTWRGWIFVSFNPDPEPFATFISGIDQALWWFKTDACRFAKKEVLEIDCNWKLLLENLIDIYHVPVLHRASFGGFLKIDREASPFTLYPRGGWTYEQESKPHSKGGRQLFPTLPWLEGMGAGTSFKAGIFPNLNLSLRFDSLRMWQVWPVSPAKSHLYMYTLFAEAAFDQPDFDKHYDEYKEFLLRAITDEDGPMVVKLQEAVGSPFYTPGPMAPLEGAVHHLMNHYVDVMIGHSR
jgi:phenylpropionate dioxygenase-like ring-hydroxylating dioxygenase large terminal subunit